MIDEVAVKLHETIIAYIYALEIQSTIIIIFCVENIYNLKNKE